MSKNEAALKPQTSLFVCFKGGIEVSGLSPILSPLCLIVVLSLLHHIDGGLGAETRGRRNVLYNTHIIGAEKRQMLVLRHF